MTNDFNILVFISGRGSNLKSLLNNADNYNIIGILSNNPEAPGLKFGREKNIPCYPLARSDYPSLKEFKAAVFKKACDIDPDLIALAGYMQIIQPEFVDTFYGRMVNIHPSLLPKYPGLDTHQRVLEAGDSEHGCTIHFVDSDVDSGPIIAQSICPCYREDTEEEIAARVLKMEHQLYPWVINSIASGDIKLNKRQVSFSNKAKQEAEDLHFSLGGNN
jgi:phosphoribosylglycinamide formyltransferase 1